MKKLSLLVVLSCLLLNACAKSGPIAKDFAASSESEPATGQTMPKETNPATRPPATLPAATQTAVPSATPTPSPTPTETPIPEPVYDPAKLGNLSRLDSYVISTQSKSVKTGEPGGAENTFEETETFIAKPRQAEIRWKRVEAARGDQPARETSRTEYWMGEAVLYYDPEGGFWSIRPLDGSGISAADRLTKVFSFFKSAQFAGQEEYNGVAANHFRLSEADLASEAPARMPRDAQLEGNLWLAQDGNYPLHLDYKMTGNVWSEDSAGPTQEPQYSAGMVEYGIDVASINQVKEINLPADMPSQFELHPDMPLPDKTILHDIMYFKGSPNFDYSYYTDLSDDEVLNFYQALQPVNGWSVKMVAKDPDGTGGIVFLTKDGKDVMVSISYFDYRKVFTIHFNYPPR